MNRKFAIYCLKNVNKFSLHMFVVYLCISVHFYQLAAIAMVGGTIWILVEWVFISDVMENQLFRAGVWLVVIGGGLILVFVPISGCCGAIRESKCLLLFVSIIIHVCNIKIIIN